MEERIAGSADGRRGKGKEGKEGNEGKGKLVLWGVWVARKGLCLVRYTRLVRIGRRH